ncbi:hypothetical protein BJ741DRAFT_630548 [Chytriomyces cf. hyalinus JEL632]|nr:hypothetical protein BJ741DRAFT_630548 [Chytriomyces cf. hyalinus JEL632]
MSAQIGRTFPNALVTFTEADPGAVGLCAITPVNGNYIAALQQSDFSTGLCGLCALISCAGAQCGGRSVAVQITDSLSGNPSSISISLPGMADLVGGESNARNVGVLTGAQWQLIQCPSVLGVQAATTQSRSPTTSSSARVSSSQSPSQPPSSTSALIPSSVSVASSAGITATTVKGANSNSSDTAAGSSAPMGAIIGGVIGGLAVLIILGFILYFYRKRTSENEKDVPAIPATQQQPVAPSRGFAASPPPPARSFSASPTSAGRSTPSSMPPPPEHVVVVERPRDKKDSFLDAFSVYGVDRPASNAEHRYDLKIASDNNVKGGGGQGSGVSGYENVDPVNWTVAEVGDWAAKRCGATEAVLQLISEQHLTGAALLLLKFESIPETLKPALYGDQVLLEYLIKRIKELHDTRLAELSEGMNNAPPSYDA